MHPGGCGTLNFEGSSSFTDSPVVLILLPVLFGSCVSEARADFPTGYVNTKSWAVVMRWSSQGRKGILGRTLKNTFPEKQNSFG